jgi:hypothetical protein
VQKDHHRHLERARTREVTTKPGERRIVKSGFHSGKQDTLAYFLGMLVLGVCFELADAVKIALFLIGLALLLVLCWPKKQHRQRFNYADPEYLAALREQRDQR